MRTKGVEQSILSTAFIHFLREMLEEMKSTSWDTMPSLDSDNNLAH